MLRQLIVGTLVAAATVLAPAVGKAAEALYLFEATAVGAFGTGPYGTVRLNETGGNVDFLVNLRQDLDFVNTGGPHSVFSFNALGVTTGDVTNVQFNGAPNPLYSVLTTGENQPFGVTFTLMIDCTSPTCQNGAPGAVADPLTFSVLNAALTDFGFFAPGTTASFAADVICRGSTLTGCNGSTGAIGVIGDDPPPNRVAEPGTLALLCMMGIGLWAGARRRRSNACQTSLTVASFPRP